MAITFKQVGEALAPVCDPEIRISLVDLGLIYGVQVQDDPKEGSSVRVTMSMTTPACPYAPMLLSSVHGALAKIPGVKSVDVDLTFEPMWDPRLMATEEAKDQLGIY